MPTQCRDKIGFAQHFQAEVDTQKPTSRRPMPFLMHPSYPHRIRYCLFDLTATIHQQHQCNGLGTQAEGILLRQRPRSERGTREHLCHWVSVQEPGDRWHARSEQPALRGDQADAAQPGLGE